DEAPQISTQSGARAWLGGLRLFAIRVLNYLTNHVVCHVPSFAFRRFWYEHVVGAELGPHAGIHLGCYIWFYGPGQVRRDGLRTGAYTRLNRTCTLDVRGSLLSGPTVSVSPEVAIITASHRLGDRDFSLEDRGVVIEDNVWIGIRATILPGVRLGRGSVVA